LFHGVVAGVNVLVPPLVALPGIADFGSAPVAPVPGVELVLRLAPV
jgi:hypothetical protein